MRIQKTAYIIIALTVFFMLCRLEAQPTPKTTKIKPGTTAQWTSKDTVIITTTVSQQVTTEQLLREKQGLLRQINEWQLRISELQAQVAYLDSISASYIDPNEP